MKKQLVIGTKNLCNRMIIKMDYVKMVIKEKNFDILFLQTNMMVMTLVFSTYQVSNLSVNRRLWVTKLDWSVTFVKISLLKESLRKKILLRIDSGFSIDNIAQLYRHSKIEENETALSQSKIQLKNITNFLQDSAVNL